MKRQRARPAVVAAGGLSIALLGAAVALVYVLQPWRSCDYEDTSMGCSMLPLDATIMTVALLSVPVGLAIFVLGRIRARRADRTHGSAHG
jgi:hypothetical protein